MNGSVSIFFFLLGLFVVAGTMLSAIRAFVLPRSSPDLLSRIVFVGLRYLFAIPMRWTHSYLERDRIMAFFAPMAPWAPWSADRAPKFRLLSLF